METYLDKNALLVVNAASKNKSNIINSVKIGNNEILASDGCILVRYPIETQEDMLIPASKLKEAKVLKFTGRVEVYLHPHNLDSHNQSTCVIKGQNIVETTLDRFTQYPDIDSCYPDKKDPTFSVSLSRDTLKKLISCTTDESIDFEFVTNKYAPVKFQCGDHHGLIMPIEKV